MAYWRAVAAHMQDYRMGFRLTWHTCWMLPAALYFARYGHPDVGWRVGFWQWK